MRGWMSLLASKRSRIGETEVYRRLLQHINFYRQLTVIGYDSGAAEIYSELRELRLRVGAMDLRIASVALHLGAVVVTRNGRDFGRVPNLIIEDWSIE